MRNKIVCFALCAMLLALCPPANAQQPKVYRIGILLPGGALYETIEGLKAGLRELGLEEGKQFTLTITDTKGDVKVAEEAAKNFERDKVSLIYALASSVITAAKGATVNVPIVFCVGSDPVAAGLVENFAKPGGRLTGVHYLVRDLTSKRLEVLKELLPKLRGVVTVYDPASQVAKESAQVGAGGSKALGTQVHRTAR